MMIAPDLSAAPACSWVQGAEASKVIPSSSSSQLQQIQSAQKACEAELRSLRRQLNTPETEAKQYQREATNLQQQFSQVRLTLAESRAATLEQGKKDWMKAIKSAIQQLFHKQEDQANASDIRRLEAGISGVGSRQELSTNADIKAREEAIAQQQVTIEQLGKVLATLEVVEAKDSLLVTGQQDQAESQDRIETAVRDLSERIPQARLRNDIT